MQNEALAFCTTDELIAELLGRTTFLGVVIHAGQDFKNGNWAEETTFRVCSNANLETDQIGRLLETVAEKLDRRSDEYGSSMD